MKHTALVVSAVIIPFVLVTGPIESAVAPRVVAGGPPQPFLALPWSPTGSAMEQYFGHSAVPAGDVDGDGDGDILVGSFSFDSLLVDAQLFLGSPQGVSSTPAWSYESGKRGPRSVAPAGDVNGDGYADVVLGFPEWNLPNKPHAGRVAVFHGGPSGLPAAPNYTLSAPGTPANEQFGWIVAPAGDVNGDNFADVIVGGPFHPEGGFNERGAVYVYHGSAAGLGAAPARTLLGPAQNGHYGLSVATAGDVNADSFADVLVGAPNANGNGGFAELHLGSAPGVVAVADTVLQGTTPNELFGWDVSTAGDVNGDDYADVLISAEGYSTATGFVRFYSGGPQGITSGITLSNPAGPIQHDHFGRVVGTLGDIDGDLFADFAVSAIDPPGNKGRVSVYRGGLSGPAYMGEIFPPDPATADLFGESVVSSGDVNGDGYTEILIGDPFSGAVFGTGQTYLYVAPRTYPRLVSGWPRGGLQPGTGYGSAVAILPYRGDFGRVVIGDPGFNGSGRITLHAGYPPLGVAAAVEESIAVGPDAEKFGARIAYVGDVDRNGFTDLLVSSPDRDNGSVFQAGRVQLYPGVAGLGFGAPVPVLSGGRDFDRVGSAIAGVGDVNGDGYHDFVVGAHQWDSAQLVDCGKAWLIPGGPAGPGAAAWSREGTFVYQGLGASVAMGDVDADGYSDVIVGSSTPPSGTPAPGKVEVFHGGPAGLSTNPGLVLPTLSAEPSFGATVATGDVTADGICDLIVGAPGQNEGVGRAFIYPGTRGRSQSMIPLWTYAGDGPGARFGAAIAAGGDLDGDGNGDLVIGEPGLDVLEENGGLVDVFYGASPVPELYRSVTYASEPPALGAFLGESLAPLIDINSDGFADIVAGAPGAAGRAYVFLGGNGPGRRQNLFLLEPFAAFTRRFHPAVVNDVDDVGTGLPLVSAAGRIRTGFQHELRIHNEPFTGAPTSTGGYLFYDTGSPGTTSQVFPNVHHAWPGRGLKVRGRVLVQSPYFQRTRWFRDGAHASGDLDFRAPGAVVDAPPGIGKDGAPQLVAVTPNPSRATSGARLGFALSRSARVTLDIFDVLGARVRRLLDADLPGGAQGVTWDGRDTQGRAVPAGLYFAVLRAGGEEDRARIVRLP